MAQRFLIRQGRVSRAFCVAVTAALIAVAPARAAADTIVSYVLQKQLGTQDHDVPVTFGAVFADGDVPAGTSLGATDRHGNVIPLQVDAKAHNKDGSLRHAVLTLRVPQLGDKPFTVDIIHGRPQSGAAITTAALPNGFDAVVDLNRGGSHLTASVRALLAKSKPEIWLSGPLVSEWWVSGPLRDAAGNANPHLFVRFGIRSYGKNRPLRVEVDVENDWTWVPGPRTEVYDVDIRMGNKSVFHKDDMVQQAQTRWRKVFWWNAPVNVFVKQDLSYLKKTRIIPNYAPQAQVVNVDQMYRRYERANRGPMGAGIITPYMPTTGGRPDIGPLPAWTVAYLLTMDPRAEEMTMNAADLSGSFPAHYRNKKTDRPTTTEEYPRISTHYNYVGRPGNLERPNLEGRFKGYHPDASHEPSLDFIPYVVTGERYYLEELQFWSQWNSWETAPEHHGYAKSLVGWDQIRGQAWSLRTLAQAAYITPDSDPMKQTLLRELKANAEWYDHTYTDNPRANIFHTALRPTNNNKAVAPWMDDFLTWAVQYAVDLGFDEFKPFAYWKGSFPVQRMINPGYCYVMATKYYIRVMSAPHDFMDSWAEAFVSNLPDAYKAPDRRPACASSEMADAFKLKHAGEMMGNSHSADGYPADMQPALAAAVDAGVPGATEAWQKVMDRPVKPHGGRVGGTWDIIPWRAP